MEQMHFRNEHGQGQLVNNSVLLVYAFTLVTSASWVEAQLQPNGRVHSIAPTTLAAPDSETRPLSKEGNGMPDMSRLLNFSSGPRVKPSFPFSQRRATEYQQLRGSEEFL